MYEVVEVVVTSTDVLAAAAVTGAWAALYALVRVATRPRRLVAAPSSGELGDEPPAVVNLIVNRWRVTSDAVAGTWLDLAARGYVELRPRGSDPAGDAAIRLRRASWPELRPYERRLLDRLRDLAGTGAVPLPALGFRHRRHARRWFRAFAVDVAVEARTRGLSRRRFGVSAAIVLLVGAAAAGLATGAAAHARDPAAAAVWLEAPGLALALAAVGLRYPGERDTARGRAAAEHWFGVAAWLRTHGSLAFQLPAAVGHWPHLPHAAALGVARVAGSALGHSVGDHRLVWSGYGGRWRRVAVRVPHGWSRNGSPPARIAVRSLAWLVGGVVLVLFADRAAEALADLDTAALGPAAGATDWLLPRLAAALLIVGALLGGLGGYALIRAVADLRSPRPVVGEVLWVVRPPSGPARVAVDDGHLDHTTVWLAPAPLVAGVRDGDIVRIVGHPWTRLIRAVTVRASGRRPREPDVPEIDADRVMADAGDPTAAATVAAAHWVDRFARWFAGDVPLLPAPGGTSAVAARYLTAEEVGAALGSAVHGPEPVGRQVAFRARSSNRMVLIVGDRTGPVTRRLVRLMPGRPLPGVGDEARLRRHGGWVRVGRTLVTVTLLGAGRTGAGGVPDLLARIANRLRAS